MCIAGRYYLTLNIDVKDGLINGGGCVLRKLSFLEQQSGKPSILWVDEEESAKQQTRKYSTYYTEDINKARTPIFSARRTFYVDRYYKPIKLEQFPLRPSSVKTLHKSQGST